MALINRQRRPFLAASTSFAGSFFGRRPEMQQIRRDVELLSQTDMPVLIQGESGTGKSFVAELLQRLSRTPGKLVNFDCLSGDAADALSKAIEGTDQDSEIVQLLTEGGTVLFDSIEELDAATQAVLLLFLKREVVAESTHANAVRVVSTTSVDLQDLVDTGKFRRDLLYHINAVKLHLIPLRQRPEDIPGLAEYYLDRYSREALRARPFLSAEVQEMMESYPWPGNLRQLDNLMKTFISMGSEEVITREVMASANEAKRNWNLDSIDLSHPVALKEITRQITHDVEREIILKVLQANGWNRQKTARWLQISYRSLLYKLNDLGDNSQSNVRTLAPRKFRAANY